MSPVGGVAGLRFAWRGLLRIPDAGFCLLWGVGLVLLVRGGGCGLVVC